MFDRARLSMTEVSSPNYSSAEGVDYSLVSQADAECRYVISEASDYGRATAEMTRITRCSWAWGEYDLVRFQLPDFVNANLIVPLYNYLVYSLSHVLGQVVDEAVIVVHDEDSHRCFSWAISIAVKRAAAFRSDSFHSCSGTESATMPDPDWM